LEGYRVTAARASKEALAALQGPTAVRPDALVFDQNLPNGITGLQLVEHIRRDLGARIPALIVTGDKSPVTRRLLADSGLPCQNKPVRTDRLLSAVAALFKADARTPSAPPSTMASISPATDADVGVVEDEPRVREALRMVLEAADHRVAVYASAEALLADPHRNRLRCLVVDLGLPGMDGLSLRKQLQADGLNVGIVFVTGRAELRMAVEAMRGGADDFLQKPVKAEQLIESIDRALRKGKENASFGDEEALIDSRIAALTERERQVLKLMLTGSPTKNVAVDLGISARTAEHYRQNVMRKMSVKSLAALVRMVGRRGDDL
jgi:two-component system CheB/CheR fusion protein